MGLPRRQYQVGPRRFTAFRQQPYGDWWVHEEWFEHTRSGEDEHEEAMHGPYSEAEAKRLAAEWGAP